MQTQAVEDYLKTIFEIQRTHGKVATTVLAERMGVAPASVTGMIKKLAQLSLVQYEKYQGVRLSAAGEKIALEVIRHHRLIELYLAEALGVPWDKVHEEAEKWEHVLSEDLEERMERALGFPTTDPHGAPIPTREGTLPRLWQAHLSDLAAGQTAVIVEVSDHDPELLRYFGNLGLYPATTVTVNEQTPQKLVLAVGKELVSIDLSLAEFIFVKDIR